MTERELTRIAQRAARAAKRTVRQPPVVVEEKLVSGRRRLAVVRYRRNALK